MNFSRRSYEKELLDDDSIPFADIRQNMKELNIINSFLGGHAISIGAFDKLAGREKNISVCEIGCGGGDNLIAIDKWCKKKDIELSVTGIDIKSECIEFAKSRKHPFSSVTWVKKDYEKVTFEVKPDIIFSSLFCHHFTDNQLIKQLQWMERNSKTGFFINDLQRNAIAYYAIKFLTSLFSTSYLVKNDAPLSVKRGFTKSEWLKIAEKAGIRKFNIHWKWAFRFVIVCKHA